MKKAFTLIELLAVITIIALLASMLLPVIQTVRDLAKQSVCANKLRGIGVMYETYANDKEGIYPPAYLRSNMTWMGSSWTKISNVHVDEMGYGTCWQHWACYLAPYNEGTEFKNGWNQKMAMIKSWNCPSAPNQPTWDDLKKVHEMAVSSYGPNTAFLGTHSGTGSNQAGWANYNRGVQGWPGYGIGISGLLDNARSTARFSRPAQTIQMAEHMGNPRTAAQFTSWTDAPFARIPFGTSGKAMTPPASWGSYVGTWPWTADGFDGWALRANHRDRSNYLFIDGHVESLSPWQTSSADPAKPNLWTGIGL